MENYDYAPIKILQYRIQQNEQREREKKKNTKTRIVIIIEKSKQYANMKNPISIGK